MKHQLDILKAILDKSGFVVHMHGKSAVIDVDHLEVELPFDLQGRRRSMIIRVEDAGWLLQEKEKTAPNFSFIQCVSILPIPIVEEAVSETVRAVNFFNRGLPAAVFIFDEGMRKIFLRYTFPFVSKEISKELFLPVFQSMLLWIDAGNDFFEKIASGETLAEVIQESLEG